MIKKCVFMLLFFLTGCNEDIDSTEVLRLVSEGLPKECEYVTLNKHYNIHFNTLKRVYDFNLNTMKNVGTMDIISIDYENDLRYAKQMELLVAQELFIKTEYFINKGNFNLAGYYTDPVTFKTYDGSVIENTVERPGGQYTLTDKGKQYLKNDPETHELSICAGHLVPKNINIVKEAENRYRVLYRVKIGRRPEWLTDEIIRFFPSIESLYTTALKNVYRIYVTRQEDGHLSAE